jgi:hypothetical protein
MNDSSNNVVILVILGIVFSAVFVIIQFSDNTSDSVKLYLGAKGGSGKSINLNTNANDMYSDNLSGYKARSSSLTLNGSQSIDLPNSATVPSVNISQTDVQNVPQRPVSNTNTAATAATVFNQTQSKVFKKSNTDILALQQNVPKTDINSTLKARTTDVEKTTAKKGKAATTKKGPQKGNDLNNGPGGQPGMGNLPIGDGTWLMLIMMGVYATRKILKVSVNC